MPLPGNRPGAGAGGTRPSTLPSTGAGRPSQSPGRNTRPVQKPDFGRPSTLPADRPGAGNRPGDGNRPGGGNWWDSGRPNRPGGGNNIGIGNGNTINIDRNFQNNINWSTNRNNWGSNPWWNRPAQLPWYGGSWNCGWHGGYRPPYYGGGYRPWPGYAVVYHDNHLAEAIGWGLVAWGLGNLIFNSGYQSYSNPYPTQPVPTTSGTPVTYDQPITVVAAETAPADDAGATAIAEKSATFIEESQVAFKAKDYLVALDAANKAVAESPGDGALHEYRALVLFALGKFSEAAGVLNPILASGPGWDWTTMVKLYDSQGTYAEQLKKLETYSASKPDAADICFLLGYHYMVCGHIESASAQFARAASLQPADTVSRQLAELTKVSTKKGEPGASPDGQAAGETPETPAPKPVPLEQLTGTWVSDKGAEGKVTLVFKDDGKFSWTFTKADASNEFAGDYSMNDNGLLVLDADQSQMVAAVELPEEEEMKFVLAGGPPGDPGLAFAKK